MQSLGNYLRRFSGFVLSVDPETRINRPTFTAEAKSKFRLTATIIIRKHERTRLPKPDRVALKSLKNAKDIIILPKDEGGRR